MKIFQTIIFVFKMEDENLSGDIFGLNIEDEIQDTSTRKICKGKLNLHFCITYVDP